MSIEEKARGSRGPSLGPRALTNQSINAFFVISKVTSRRISRIKGGNGSSSVQVAVASDEDGYESAGALAVTSWNRRRAGFWTRDALITCVLGRNILRLWL